MRGYLRHVWEKSDAERNEPLDLEVYAYAAAVYYGLNRVNWDRVEATLLMTAGDLFVQAHQQQQQQQQPAAPPARLNEPEQPAQAAASRGTWLDRRDSRLKR